MENSLDPIQIALTPEQQQLIRKLSGQSAQFLELTPEPADPTAGAGSGLRFRWHLSTATGIPAQQLASEPPQVEPQG